MAFISVPQSPIDEKIDPVAAFTGLLPSGTQAEQALALGALFITLLLVFLARVRAGRQGGKRAHGRNVLPFGHRPKRPGSGLQIAPMQEAARPAAPNDHLALVAASGFRVVPLLTYSEARILPMLDRIVREMGQGHRVMAQVAMGEVLRASAGFESPANRAINAKRLDFVIVDRRGMMVAALEYQGSGHHISETAFIRDAVKREALRKAGLWLIELPKETDEALLRARLSEQTDLPMPRDRAQPRAQDGRA